MSKETGERIKGKRKEMKFTQKELANIIDNTGPAISDWETGKGEPRLKNIISLAKALGTTTDYLLTGNTGKKEGEEMTTVTKLKQILTSPFIETKDKHQLIGYITELAEKEEELREKKENKNIHTLQTSKKFS